MGRRDRDGEEIEVDVASSDDEPFDRGEFDDEPVDRGEFDDEPVDRGEFDDESVDRNDSVLDSPDRDDADDESFDRDDAALDSLHDGGSDADLADELGRISIRSTPEGYVEGRVTGLSTLDETTVRLDVRLPHGRTVEFNLEKPIPWSEAFLLARIVEHLGYDAATVDHVVDETVYVARTDLEDDGTGWWPTWDPARTTSEFLETVFGRFVETDSGPTWRLVDPRELPDPEPDDRTNGATTTVATTAVVLGTIAAAVGAVVGATGGLTISAAAALYAFPGLVLVLVGLLALHGRLAGEAGP